MRLQDHYQEVLSEIVDEQNIQRVRRPNHKVSANAGRIEVIQHTEWYVGGSGDSQPHYRYRRYREVMGRLAPGDGRKALVDLGCGAGLFSWAFLDWASERGMSYERLDLYGLDHCPAMLQLAQEIRSRLLRYLPNYPALHYGGDVDALCNQLTGNHIEGTDYTITLGHVLVQAHAPDEIKSFTQVINHIMGLIGPGRNCTLVAVDANRERIAFAEGWEALLSSLERVNVHHEELPISPTAINDNGRAKLAWLTLAR